MRPSGSLSGTEEQGCSRHRQTPQSLAGAVPGGRQTSKRHLSRQHSPRAGARFPPPRSRAEHFPSPKTTPAAESLPDPPPPPVPPPPRRAEDPLAQTGARLLIPVMTNGERDTLGWLVPSLCLALGRGTALCCSPVPPGLCEGAASLAWGATRCSFSQRKQQTNSSGLARSRLITSHRRPPCFFPESQGRSPSQINRLGSSLGCLKREQHDPKPWTRADSPPPSEKGWAAICSSGHAAAMSIESCHPTQVMHHVHL